MTAEITAEMLARKVYSGLGADYDGPIPSFWTDAAETFLALTRAYAALQEQPTEAPGRVRCWYVEDYGIVMNLASSDFIGRNITPGHFTPEAHE